MALEMRAVCERCEATLTEQSEAFICVYECTFCAKCTHEMNWFARIVVANSCGGRSENQEPAALERRVSESEKMLVLSRSKRLKRNATR